MAKLTERELGKRLGLTNINIVEYDKETNTKVINIIDNSIERPENEDLNEYQSYMFDLIYMFNTHIDDKSSDFKKEVAKYLRQSQVLNKG